MRPTTTLLLALGILSLAGCGGGSGATAVAPRAFPLRTASFVHTATTLNTSDDITYLDHTIANGNPLAVLIVTPNWNPVAGGSTVFFNHPYAVAYAATIGQWGIVTEDGADVTEGASFNVTVAEDEIDGTVALYRHAAVAATMDGAVSRLDHPRANNQPDALLFCTRNLTPAGGLAPAQAQSFSVTYRLTESQWVLHNQDLVPIQAGSSFNVAIVPAGGAGAFANAWIHQSTAGDTEFNYTYLGGALPRDAVIHAMPFNCAMRGYDTAHGDHYHGVWFDDSDPPDWGVFNEDLDSMVVGRAFNIAVCGVASP